MRNGYVYILFLNKSNVFYVGSSTNLEKRKVRHLSNLRNGTHHNSNLQQAWKDSGSDNIRLGIIAEGTEDEIRKIEQNEILKYQDDRRLMNIGLSSIGGDNFSNNPEKDKIAERISNGLKRKFANMSNGERKRFAESRTGEKNGMYGKTHSPEIRKFLSEVQSRRTPRRGFSLSESHKAAISQRQKLRIGEKNHFYGKNHSEKTKNRIRDMVNKRLALGFKPGNSKKIVVDGVEYLSAGDASKALGIKHATLTHRARSKNKKFSSYFYKND